MMGSAACRRRQLADETIKSSNAIQKVLGKLPALPEFGTASIFKR
jgi:hypothetical protein